MTIPPGDLPNPYASPSAAEEVENPAEEIALPRTREIWFATIAVWLSCAALSLVASYVLLGWAANRYPQLHLQIESADKLAQFATGAANAIAMSALVAYGQYYAVICRDLIWSRTIALLLIIGSVVIGFGSVLIFAGTSTMWLLLMPSALASVLSLLMFRWYALLFAFRRKHRRELGKRRLFAEVVNK